MKKHRVQTKISQSTSSSFWTSAIVSSNLFDEDLLRLLREEHLNAGKPGKPPVGNMLNQLSVSPPSLLKQPVFEAYTRPPTHDDGEENKEIPSTIAIVCPPTKSERACTRLYSQAKEKSKMLTSMRKVVVIKNRSTDNESFGTVSTRSRTSTVDESVDKPDNPDRDRSISIYERLNNRGQSKQMEGKQRRQAIALASAKAKEIPDFSEWTIPLQNADDFYRKSIRDVLAIEEKRATAAHERNSKYLSRYNFNNEVKERCGFGA